MAESIDNFNDLIELGIDGDVSELEEEFGKAADHLPKLVSTLNDETLLTLYAYYKQGREGNCNTPKPSFFDFKGRSKWEAWKKLENTPTEVAKLHYVDTIRKIDPNFTCTSSVKGKTNWVCVSTMQNDEADEDYPKDIVDYIRENDREKVVKKLSGVKDINKLDRNGLSLIHWASDIGSPGVIEDLLTKGADVNIRDSDGQTPLHYSASCGHVECVKLLLDKGASIDAQDNEGLTPLDVANDEVIKQLIISSSQ